MTKTASINTLRGKLRFQISSEYTRNYHPEIKKGNKYIYLGVDDSPKNRNKAEDKLLDLKEDLEQGKYDPNNESKYHIKQFINKVKISLPTVTELCLNHWNWKYKQKFIEESTYKARMHDIKIISTLNQNLSQINWIIESIENSSYSKQTQQNVLHRIKSAIVWGVNKKHLPDIFLNRLEEFDFTINQIKSYLKKHPPRRTNSKHGDENDTRYFSEQDMNTIIKAFRDKYGSTSRTHLVEFGFKTGLRLQEIFALTWGDLYYKVENDEDVLWISVNKAYATNIKKIKCTKIDETRKFQLSKSTQLFIERIRPHITKSDSLIFQPPKAKHFATDAFHNIWYGTTYYTKLKSGEVKTKFSKGIVTKLAEDRKIAQYLPAYQMRATFINHKLLAGVNPIILSKWTGHDVKTMMKHYESLTGSEQRMPD